MEHTQRLIAATLITDDRYPGYALIHPYPGLYIPATVEYDIQVTPCPAYGDTGACFFFGSAASAWEFVQKRIESPLNS